MKLEVQWLAYLATQAGILDSAKCLVLKHALGPDADILALGEKLYDRGYCSDFDKLQDLVKDAYQKAEANEPVPHNPFRILSSSSKLTFGENRSQEEDKQVGKPPDTAKPLSLRNSNPLTPEPTPEPVKAEISIPEPISINSDISIQKSNTSPIQRWKPSRNRKGISLPTTSGTLSFPGPVETHPEIQGKIEPIQPAPSPVENQVTKPEKSKPQLSKERPPVSPDVPDAWPVFEAIKSMSDEALRQSMVQLLFKSRSAGASDVHLSANARPFIRRNRKVEYLTDYELTQADSLRLNSALLSDFQFHSLDKDLDLDHALSLDIHLRYRVNLMKQKDGYSGTYRLVPNEIKSLEELGFGEPDIIRDLLNYHNGLILVTGPLGSGKTATLAALVDELNKTRQDHLISVESPIEIIHHSDLCHITQREVGYHTNTFHSALKGALRQDPDIIVIGEMRDLETVEMAITASETGHLVIGTMHTSDASNTLNRLLDVFPAAKQTQIRSMVAESLKGIICQRLLPSTEDGVELVYELLLNNPAVANLIRSNKAEGLSNIIETGRSEGMVLMDKSIFERWESGRISDEVALANLISRPMKQQIIRNNEPEVEIEEPVKKRFSLSN